MIDASRGISILTKKMSLDAHLAFVMVILKNAIEIKAMEDVRLKCNVNNSTQIKYNDLLPNLIS